MDFIRACTISLLIGACFSPAAYANEAEYNTYVEGAMQVYKNFAEPSVQESNRFLSFVEKRWKSVSTCRISCTDEGLTAAMDYASTNKIKMNDEI